MTIAEDLERCQNKSEQYVDKIFELGKEIKQLKNALDKSTVEKKE